MKTVFADTFFFIALISQEDKAHQRAIQWVSAIRQRMLTTTWVITELADGFSGAASRRGLHESLAILRRNPYLTIIPPTQELFDAGLDLHARRLDKDWSLTDCISFVVMERHGIAEALTGDKHFEQAGFRVLMKS